MILHQYPAGTARRHETDIQITKLPNTVMSKKTVANDHIPTTEFQQIAML